MLAYALVAVSWVGFLSVCVPWPVPAAMSKKPKLAATPKVSGFRRVSKVSASALADILARVRDEGLPDAIRDMSVRRHRNRAVDRDTEFGKLL